MTSNIENKANTNRFIEKMNKVKGSPNRGGSISPLTNEDYKKSLIKCAKQIAKRAYAVGEDGGQIEELFKEFDEINNPNGIGQPINHVSSIYNVINDARNDLLNEDKQIKRLEREAHFRNILARGATTLVIGFSIMAVYWVAQCLKITMPMLRLATGS